VNEPIEFFVPWTVKPKGNSKTIVHGKNGRTYLIEPKKNRENADALKLLFAQHAPPQPLEGPVRVEYRVTYGWLGKHGKRLRALGRRIPKTTRPDLGQLEKQLDDVLEAAGFVADDAQIVERESCKCHGTRPGVEVWIMPSTEDLALEGR
jgi:Holliday junction resolvase RusA-like endonuclease